MLTNQVNAERGYQMNGMNGININDYDTKVPDLKTLRGVSCEKIL